MYDVSFIENKICKKFQVMGNIGRASYVEVVHKEET